MNHSVWMFAATYPEWLNWIAVGRIRCNGRITRVNGVDDHKGFALLLDRAPDISIDDDQAYIIAKLKPNFRSFQQDFLRVAFVWEHHRYQFANNLYALVNYHSLPPLRLVE